MLVGERLPEDDGDYLVTMVTPGYFKGRPYTNWLCWDGDNQEWTDTDGDTIPEQDTVVAWRSIPEPYQPQQADKMLGVEPGLGWRDHVIKRFDQVT